MKPTTIIAASNVLAAVLFALVPGGARAQSVPKTLFACYVSSTGTVYLIKEPGLRTDCANQNHIPFSWIDGVPDYDHGVLNGRADDDHPQYLLVDGTRALTGPLHAGGFKIVGLAAGTEAGDVVRYEQAVKAGDPAGGDLSGAYPNPSVAKLQGLPVSSTAPTAGQILSFTGEAWAPVTPPAPASGTPDNIPNTLVQRDASGGFQAGPVTMYELTVGPTTPAGRAHFASDGGFVIQGTPDVGRIPTSGSGVRLMWHPGKAAFRSGTVDGTQWDDVNVGEASTAMGYGTTASYVASTAMGFRTTASHFASTALGYQTTASAVHSTAMGDNTTASGDRSTAMGVYASTNAFPGSFVYGDQSTVGSGTLVQPIAANQFVIRASGGVRLFTSSNTGLFTFEGGSGAGCNLAGLLTGPGTVGTLICSGVIASTTGIGFPDGTVQTTAGAGGVSDHGALTGLSDDDHAQYLLTDGVRVATNGFSITGTLGSGTLGTSGPGTRLVWYPSKGAFRAGHVCCAEAASWDDANVGQHSVAMGLNTTASGMVSTALGSHTTASGLDATALGSFTRASGDRSTAIGAGAVASGTSSTAMGASTTAGGAFSTAVGAGTTASGNYSLAAGFATTASGTYTTVMGTFASTGGHAGSFVYGDASGTVDQSVVSATATNQFVVRASGGLRFRTSPDLSTGCDLPAGSGTWSCTSSREAKENFRDEDGEAVLGRIARLPIQSWNYRTEGRGVRHVGPTAQDFYAAFGLGEGETTITTVDADGVALLAIQALERRTRDLERENARLRAALEALRDEVGRQRRQP